MKKIIITFIIALATFGFMQKNETITVKGSDTMVILAQPLAGEKMEAVLIYYLENGSVSVSFLPRNSSHWWRSSRS